MVEVIGQDEAQSKEESCGNCGARLKYYKRDVQEGCSTDYAGGKDYYDYIVCPTCSEHVEVDGF